jgi:GABA(A) receptor-associated protein
MDFRSRFSFEQRAAEASRIHTKFPGRVPCIVQKANRSKTVPAIDKEKFLVPGDLTLGQFVYVIRKRIALDSDKALFVFVGNALPTTGSLMRELFHSHGESDGFLYLMYCGESTFGEIQ